MDAGTPQGFIFEGLHADTVLHDFFASIITPSQEFLRKGFSGSDSMRKVCFFVLPMVVAGLDLWMFENGQGQKK